jgi:hypothetical protein
MSDEPTQAAGQSAMPESAGSEHPIIVNVSVGSPAEYSAPSLAAGATQRRREQQCLCQCGSQTGSGGGR